MFKSQNIALFLFAISPLFLCGQAADSLDLFNMSLDELSKVSVSATTRVENQPISEASSSITVITARQIKERGYLNLIDVLEDIPDFKIDRNVDSRWLHDITLRGVRSMDKILILLDGVRISSPTNERIPIYANYPIHYAKQIEIIKGPASALYGADAFSGVINIVTKDEANKEISGSITGGMYELVNSNLFLQKQLGSDLHISISGQYHYDMQPDLADFYPEEYQGRDESLRSGTFNTIFGTITPSTPVNPEKGYSLEAWALNGKLDYKKFSLGFFGNHAKVPSTTANSPNNSVYNEEQMFGHNIKMITGKYSPFFGKIASTFQVTYSTYGLDEESNFRNVFTRLEPAFKYAESDKIKGEVLFTFPISEHLKVTAGSTYERFNSIPRSGDLQDPAKDGKIEEAIVVNSRAENNPDGIAAELIEVDYKNIGAMTQLNWHLKDWNITLGARLDSDDRFDPTFNPRAGIVYNPSEKYTVKALYGRAYLAPSPQNIYDRFGTFLTTDQGITYSAPFLQLPNTTLQPQTVSTYELDGKYFLSENLAVNFSAYYSQVSNLISAITSDTNFEKIEELYPDMIYTQDGRTFRVDTIQINDNLGRSDIYGSSIELRYIVPINRLSGDFSASYSYIAGNIDIDEEGPTIERNLPGVSPHVLRLIGTISSQKFSLNIRLQVVSNQRTISANSTIDTGNDGTFNDEEYQHIDGYHLLNLHATYKLSDKISLSLSGNNVTDQRYRNVNIGANPSQSSSVGSGEVEFFRGAPQNPIRILAGVQFFFK